MTTLTNTPVKLSDQQIQRAKSVDLIALAERYTTLRRESARERSRPCPNYPSKCGKGNDGFHVSVEGWFFCRGCHPKRGDSIEFVRHYQGCDFRQAIATLTGDALPTVGRRVAPVRKAQEIDPEWHETALRKAGEATERLYESEGEPGRAYLESRGLESHTWLRYLFGYDPAVPLPGTKGKERRPAIVIPWFAGGRVAALRYRFLEAHTYTDADRKERTEKQTALAGSQFAGHLWGGPLSSGAESSRWLLIVEGEINGASCWQVAHETNLEVLSLGSESATIPPDTLAYIHTFGRVIAWADREKVAQRLKAIIPDAYPVQSPKGQDANDLLQAGKLGGFLVALRAAACRNPAELEALYFDSFDAADRWQGIDTSTAARLQRLAAQLGKESS